MAPRYSLVVKIEERHRAAFACRGDSIVIARTNGAALPSVIWLALPPAPLTQITWSHSFGVFAARVPARAGSAIEIVAAVHPALDRTLYPFTGEAFGDPQFATDVPRSHYEVRNESPAGAAFGLLQTAQVEDAEATAPVNLVTLPPAFVADFAPPTDVHIWLAREARSGAVISAPSNGAIIATKPGVSAYVEYDPMTLTFTLSALRVVE